MTRLRPGNGVACDGGLITLQDETMTKVQLARIDFDYCTVDGEDRGFIKQRALLIHDMARKTGEAIRLIGQWLTEVKERLPHGAWLPWLQTEFGWSDETARKMMRVYECLKSQQSLNLEIDVSALYLIAAPSTPEPVREEVIRRAQSGESMTHAKAVEVVHSHQQRRTMPTFPVDPSIAKSIRKAQRAARKLAAEQLTIRILYEAIELLAETDVKPEEMVVLGRKHDCLSLEVWAVQAGNWLQKVVEKAQAK